LQAMIKARKATLKTGKPWLKHAKKQPNQKRGA
jgi:hypothetical protein